MTETDETSYILSSVTYDRKYSCIGGEEKKCQQSQNAQQSGPSGDETNPTMSYREAPRHRKLLLVSLVLVDFFGYASFSMLAPFFPAEAEKKGASQIVVGLIFGIFELTIFLVSPIIGSFITKIGAKRTYLSGCMLAGACSIAFGLLDKCQGGTLFIVLAFIFRVLEGIGCSMFITAGFAIIANVFPDKAITVFGALETFCGLGLLCGPAVGGALYQAGGYQLPFFVVGCACIMTGVFGYFFLPGHGYASKSQSRSLFYLLRNPYTWVSALGCATGSFSMGFLEPTLALKLSILPELNGKTGLIGLMFMIGAGTYSISAPFWGYIVDKKHCVLSLMSVGNILGTIAWLLMGPSPFLKFLHYSLVTISISLFLMGIGSGVSSVPTFRGLLDSARELGMEDNMDTHGTVSGFFNSTFSLGAFLGPTLGGILVYKIGFNWAATCLAGLNACTATTVILFGICRNSRACGKRQGYQSLKDASPTIIL